MRFTTAQIVGFAGCAVLLLGAILPWASGSFTLYNGLDPRGAGMYLLGIPAGALAGLLLSARWSSLISLALGCLAIGVTVLQRASIMAESERDGLGSTMAGLYFFGAGGAILVIGAALRLRERRRIPGHEYA